MTKALLVVAALIDLALAALLVGVSGFVTGGGPESMNAGRVRDGGLLGRRCRLRRRARLSRASCVDAKGGAAAAPGRRSWHALPAGALVALMVPAPY